MKLEEKAGNRVLQYLTAFLVLSIAGIILISFLYYRKQKSTLKMVRGNELSAMADMKVKQIIDWRRERMEDALPVFNNPRLAFNIIQYNKFKQSGITFIDAFDWMRPMYKSGRYRSIIFFNPDKKIIHAIPEKATDHSAYFSDKLLQSRSEKKMVFSDLLLDESGVVSLPLIIPAFNNKPYENIFLGWIVLYIDPSRDLFPLIQILPMNSVTAEAILVSRKGNSVLYLNELRHRKNTAMKLELPLSLSNLPAVYAVKGIEGIVEGTDYRGTEVLAVTRKIPDSSWYLVAKIDKNECLSDLRKVSIYILIFTFLVISTLSACYALIVLRHKAGVQQAKMQLDFERKLLATRYDYISRFANDAIFLINEQEKIIEVNDKAIEMYGYSHEEITGIPVDWLWPREIRQTLKETINKIRMSGNGKFETIHQRKNGSRFQVEASTRYINLDDQYYFQMIARDITERKESEKRLQHANRLYAFLSQVNQAIIRSRSVHQLLEEITRVAVEFGKFRMAWTGLTDELTNKVIPLCQSGYGGNYLKKIVITVNDEPSGRGPTGTAIRTGQLVTSNDIKKDSRMKVWRGNAIAHGYRSSAAIPLKKQNKIIGTLTLYSEEPGFFTETETNLLQEISEDIAFAIDSIDASQVLKENEEKFQTFVEQSSEGILLTDEKGNIIVWNKAMEKITAWQREQVLEKSYLEIMFWLLHPADRDKYNPELNKSVMTEAFQMNQSPFLNKTSDMLLHTANGESKNVMQMVFPIKTEKGNCIGAIINDISDRKYTEEALVKERLLLLTLINNIPDVIYVKDTSMRKILVNEADLNLIGKPEHEVLGKTDLELFPPEIAEKFMTVDKEVIKYGKTVLNREELVINNKAQQSWLLTSKLPLYDLEGRISGLVGIGHDITERKQAEKALAENEERFRGTLDNMLEGCQIISHDYKYLYVNNAAAQHGRVTIEELIGRTMMECFPGIEKTEMFRTLQNCMTDRIAHRIENEFCYSDGTSSWFDLSFQPVPEGIFILSLDITGRKQLEHNIRESEKKYRLLADNISDVIWIMDIDADCIRYVSPSIEKLSGYSVEDVMGQTLAYMVTHDSLVYIRQQLPARLVEFQKGFQKFYTDEIEQPCKDGTTVWTEITTRYVMNDENNHVEIYGVSRNISERRKSEEVLRYSEERYRTVAEFTYDWEYWRAPDGTFMYVSPSCEKITGYSPDAFLTDPDLINRIIHPNDLDSFKTPHLASFPIHDDRISIDIRIIRSDGQVIWINHSCIPVFDSSGKSLGRRGSNRDITERKQMEEEIRRLNSELEQRVQERTAELTDLYNNAPCGYHSLDRDGLYVLINDTELKWLGYTREEILGKKKFSDLLTDKSAREFYTDFPVFKNQGWTKDLELDMVRKDGSILPIVYSATSIAGEDGKYLMSRSTIIDNSERKSAMEAMYESQQKLEHLNQELEAFAYSVSHDLRAPLRAIDGFARILMEEYSAKFDEEGKRICRVISNNSMKMGQLIDNLLSFSRLSHSAIHNSIVNMKTMVSDMYNETIGDERKVKFRFTLRNLPDAFGDPEMLKQVWINLLSNADKYTRKCKEPTITVGYTQSETDVIYYIKDNGIGFEQKYADNLFGVFQRLHKSDEFEGTGVGLAIVKRIINRHGGRVWAEGESNKGATFYFTLPNRS